MFNFAVKIGVIGCLYCIAGTLLYRGRVVNRLPALESDLVVFALPLLLVLIGYGAVFWLSHFFEATPRIRIAGMVGFSVLAAALSHWAFILIAFNMYGT